MPLTRQVISGGGENLLEKVDELKKRSEDLKREAEIAKRQEEEQRRRKQELEMKQVGCGDSPRTVNRITSL